jgi:hypothetical protein
MACEEELAYRAREEERENTPERVLERDLLQSYPTLVG